MTGGVFISYRREDSGGYAGRINDRLISRLGRENVFFDVDTIPPGRDFEEVLSERVGKCDALLAVIGKHWVFSADSENKRRLDDPKDFVRIEIEAALNRDVPVIPVLVDGAPMPRAEDLPDSLKRLIRRQAVEITHARFDSDAERLTEALSQIEEEMLKREAGAPSSAAGRETGRATLTAAAERASNRASEPSGPAKSVPARAGNSRSLVYLAVLGLIAVGAVGLLFAPPALRKAETAIDAKPIASIREAPSARTDFSAAEGDRLDGRRIDLVKAATASLCTVAKDGAGKTNDVLVRGAVMSELGGMLGKMADAGSIAAMSHDDFEGLTREAVAIAIAGAPDCETQLFPKMLARLAATTSATNVNSGACSIAVSGNASGNSVSCGASLGAKP